MDTRSAPRFGTILRISTRRRFKGRINRPPFVLIRRTSAPDDKDRVVTTIVGGARPVAVENHLLVLRPLHGGLEDCRRLARWLQGDQVRRAIDKMIRCRHLTVRVIGELRLPPRLVALLRKPSSHGGRTAPQMRRAGS
jgi:hypothetical protein